MPSLFALPTLALRIGATLGRKARRKPRPTNAASHGARATLGARPGERRARSDAPHRAGERRSAWGRCHRIICRAWKSGRGRPQSKTLRDHPRPGKSAQRTLVQIARYFGVEEICCQTYGGFETGGSKPAGSQIKTPKVKMKMLRIDSRLSRRKPETAQTQSNPVQPISNRGLGQRNTPPKLQSVQMLNHPQHSGDGAGLIFPFPSPCLHCRSHFRSAKTCPSPLGRGDGIYRLGRFLARQLHPRAADHSRLKGMLGSSQRVIKNADECFLVPTVKSRNLP
jgi:hypothetical protein